METGIYIELSENDPREKNRSWGYVLEAPGGWTKHETGECTGTMHGVTLQILIKALGRYHKPSQITIHAADEWVLNMLENQLPAWEQNGFRNTRGEPIKYQQEWEQLAEKVKDHKITIAPGRHEYSVWLQDEMKRGR